MKDFVSPVNIELLAKLRAGTIVRFSGYVYTMRDAAHRRFLEDYDNGQAPFDIEGATVFYAGPAPAAPDEIIGSCGPTTSSRMDAYTPRLLSLGMRCMIGKGGRSEEVQKAIKAFGAVYLIGTGGAAALLSRHITSSAPIAYPDLGCEEIRLLYIDSLPLIVAIDPQGNSILPLS